MKPLAAKGVSVAEVVEGTGVTVEQLRDKKERLDWATFVSVMRNMRPHFTDEEYVALGRSFMHSPALRFAFVVARLAFSPIDIYRWSNKPRDGLGNQMFTCVIPSYREKSANELQIELTLPEGYEPYWEFFVIVSGNNEELPRLFGLPRATVQLTKIPGGARYDVTVPTWRVPFLKRIWRFLAWPFTARAAARELKEAHESMIARYAELEDARSKIDRQATQLHTAHVVNELVQRDMDLARTLETIVNALVSEAGFASAEIRTVDNQTARAGEGGEVAIERTLETRGGKAIGELRVAPKRDADLVERSALLDFVVPSLSMAVENATYRTHLERLVEDRTRELRDAQGARERFFAHISHEIRTPLTIITLAVSDVVHRTRELLDPRSKKNLEAVNDAARKLVRLVDELLLLAAGQEGKLTTHPEPTNLVELLANIEAAWQLAAQPAGLTMRMRAPSSLVANVDPVAMERVLTNLVSNAVKYTPRGGSIDIELASDSNGVRISVFDTGPGISAELAGRLFGRFERAVGATAHGTGLGLALSRQLVNAHRGTIDAHPRPGGGCELRVFLPRELVLRDAIVKQSAQLRLVDQVPSMEPPATAEHVAARASQGTVLLAEDDVRLAELVAGVLSSDYHVVVAHDGVTALELARKHHPHLLITDVDMPGLDGMELARRFRELTGDRLAPIIILSAMLDLGTRVAGLEAGAIDYITKPFDPMELRARVQAQFRSRELAVRLHRAEQVSSLGILTSGLAHELRNPANAIVNAVEPLVQRLPGALLTPGSPVAELVDVIRQCAEQIRSLSKQLLGMRNEEMDLEVRESTIGDIVQRALLLAQQRLKAVAVRTRIDDVVLKCAPPLLTQALTNLVENAGDAAGPNGWVEVRAKTDGTHVIVEVTDSGPGVPEVLRERVFEPFFTTKAASAGTGLGLSLAREIIQRHAGTLDIQARPGGSVFVIRVPGVCLPATSVGAI